MTQRIEWRAIVRRPASIFDADADRDKGFVLYATTYGPSKERVMVDDYNLSRVEESHSYIDHWQCRVVTIGEWTDE